MVPGWYGIGMAWQTGTCSLKTKLSALPTYPSLRPHARDVNAPNTLPLSACAVGANGGADRSGTGQRACRTR